MVETNEWLFPRGSLARDGWESVVDGSLPGWRHTGLRIAELGGRGEGDGAFALPAGDVERLVVPLAGAFTVEHGGLTDALGGRASVFDGPTDVLYVGAGTAATISGAGRVAVAEAPTPVRHPDRLIRRDEVPVEIRGAGRATRQVHDVGGADVLEAGSFLVCEVITPAGNWSSHPAHKHDERVEGVESRLEEIYWFEVAPARGLDAPAGADPVASFATCSSPAGEIETNALVRTGDIALVPFGYHGPAAAAPEYDLYYLNVMAGPDPERVWLVTDDPRQAWIRSTWADALPDPRLPYGARGLDERAERDPATPEGASR